MNLFDASALLAFLGDEPGAERVEAALLDGGACSAANWSETAQKVRQHGGDWTLCRGLLLGYPLTVEPVTQADAERAAERWRPGTPLSLGDRLCLAQADRLRADVWTADSSWDHFATLSSGAMIRQIRDPADRPASGDPLGLPGNDHE